MVRRVAMTTRVPRWFLIGWIVSLSSGCDNVSFGGIRMSLQGPPGDTTAVAEDTVATEPAGPTVPVVGPLLFSGLRTGDSAVVFPVAVLEEGAFKALPGGDEGARWAEHMLETRLVAGARFHLFSQGVRIGSFTATGGGELTTEYCSPRAQTYGRLEILPQAMDAQRFLALEETGEALTDYRPYEALRSQARQRVASVNMASGAITEVGARWPPDLLATRQDLQVFRLRGDDEPSVIATFLHRDWYTLSRAPDEAYSLMVLGEPEAGDYAHTFTWYRRVGDVGKAAPRFFSHLDWDGDGEDEILLEVLGEGVRWWSGLDRGVDGWQVAFEDPCGSGEAGEASGSSDN
jgi:hypothetical protein